MRFWCLFFSLAASLAAQRPIQKPRDVWQKPGEIQQPKGPWQKPGEIQKVHAACEDRLTVGADALFAFDQSTLTPQAESTLREMGPQIAQAGSHPVSIEGHTDSVGTTAYNQTLSEKRAQAVRDWLLAHNFLKSAATTGFGPQKPVAPNTTPEGRQKNRRVEVVIHTCK